MVENWELDAAKETIIFLTECTLATVEHLKLLARPSKSEIRRQQNIADRGLDALRTLRVTPQEASKYRCPRVYAKLAASPLAQLAEAAQ